MKLTRRGLLKTVAVSASLGVLSADQGTIPFTPYGPPRPGLGLDIAPISNLGTAGTRSGRQLILNESYIQTVISNGVASVRPQSDLRMSPLTSSVAIGDAIAANVKQGLTKLMERYDWRSSQLYWEAFKHGVQAKGWTTLLKEFLVAAAEEEVAPFAGMLPFLAFGSMFAYDIYDGLHKYEQARSLLASINQGSVCLHTFEVDLYRSRAEPVSADASGLKKVSGLWATETMWCTGDPSDPKGSASMLWSRTHTAPNVTLS